MPPTFSSAALTPGQAETLAAMSTMFGEAFGEPETYCGKRPSRAWLERLLARPDFIALAARDGAKVVGGLVAYVLDKFERERSEVYIYDLAVAEKTVEGGVSRGGGQYGPGQRSPRLARPSLRLAGHRDEPGVPGEQLVRPGA